MSTDLGSVEKHAAIDREEVIDIPEQIPTQMPNNEQSPKVPEAA